MPRTIVIAAGIVLGAVLGFGILAILGFTPVGIAAGEWCSTFAGFLFGS